MLSRIFRAVFSLYRIKKDPVGYARSLGVKVGQNCRFIGITSSTFGSEPYLIEIGDHVTITNGVNFITHDGGVWVYREQYPDIDIFGKIVIGNNVFIGLKTLLLPGTVIGDNCIIGAGSVVNREIPANSVAAGIPAKVIKSTEAYWSKIKTRAVYIRSLPQSEKRRILLKKFGSHEEDV